jgi:methyltransferase (TIGR00027 family)
VYKSVGGKPRKFGFRSAWIPLGTVRTYVIISRRKRMKGQAVPDGVSLTAVSVAVARSWESQRADRLFDDPFARDFLSSLEGLLAADFPADPQSNEDLLDNAEYVAVRTLFFDNFLLEAVACCPQVVILAAGLDARAFRLDWPAALRLFEVDLPNLLKFKEPVLDARNAVARCRRTVVAADLCADWSANLLSAGFRPERSTAWLAEGLLPYLTAPGCDQLAQRIRGLSGPGSWIALEHFDAEAVRRIAARPSMAVLEGIDAVWKSTMEDPQPWLAEHGWVATASRAKHHAEQYGRVLAPDYSLCWLAAGELSSG